MNERLKQLIRLKTNGRQKDFADLVGWSPQYVQKLLRNGDFGIKPVTRLLEVFPELNARWLITGEGSMLMDDQVNDLRRGAFNHIQAVLELEKYVQVMNGEELAQYEMMILAHKKPCFSPEAKARWIEQLHETQQEKEQKVKTAIIKSESVCRQRTAKK